MYKVVKEKGRMSTVSVVNTDTNKSIDIGIVTNEIITLLTEDGYTFNFDTDTETEGAIDIFHKWDLKVSEEVGKKLAMLTLKLKITKPVRVKKKVNTKTKVDAMDVLFGRASY